MSDAGDDFTVDVLVIGAGAQGRYVANALAPRYSVCVLTDPAVGATTLDTPGLVSAGYTGNDAVRMQAARRTAGFWRHWAETSDTRGASTPSFVSLFGPEVAPSTRRWEEAGLTYSRADLPHLLGDGRLSLEATTFRVDGDVVVDPGELLRSITPSDVPFIDGTVSRFGLDADTVIDHVDIETLRGIVSVAPRFVVLAAGVGNAALLAAIARRFRDQSRRRLAGREARESQAVIDHHVVALRSAQLPVIAGTFGDIEVVAHPVPGSSDVVWLITARSASPRLAAGERDLRFDPPIDPERVAEIVRSLRTASPLIDAKPHDFEWSAYVTREAVHPVAAEGGPMVGTPLPARLDAFGLDSFLALWPSHLGYTMLLGDVVAERVGAALGDSAGPIDPRLLAVARSAPPAARSRWWSPSFLWHDWGTFAAIQGLPAR